PTSRDWVHFEDTLSCVAPNVRPVSIQPTGLQFHHDWKCLYTGLDSNLIYDWTVNMCHDSCGRTGLLTLIDVPEPCLQGIISLRSSNTLGLSISTSMTPDR
ncbi:hypothetical protein P7K49_006131, partial [Saguinus oedipus]